jgi:N-formylglutamate amidohydrolase
MPHPNVNRQDRPARSKQIAVLHIPHSSRHVPAEERQAILLDDGALNDELLRMTDAYTDELFPVTPFEAGRMVLPVSRLVCDVERFPSDERRAHGESREDFCIGTDSFHTPAVIRDTMVTAVKEAGYSVAVDAPFAGALVPLSFYRKDDRVLSVMIEVNRRLYMDEQSGRRSPDFDQVCAAVGRLIENVAEMAVRPRGARFGFSASPHITKPLPSP